MNTSNILKTLAIVTACTGLLAGCMAKNSPTDVVNDVQTPIDYSNVPAAEPTLSNSTDTNDLKKELNETTMPSEDYSDL